ncbi:hypothetical protein [Scytonema sp. PCC 10023]|uniref:hypothetical protein n=1 Tax=Scytonema sp. PCC 10023 TaxID=1680591 RepID=UPI0039C67DEB
MKNDFNLIPKPHELQQQIAEAVSELKEELSLEQGQLQNQHLRHPIGLSTGLFSALSAIAHVIGSTRRNLN